MAEYNPAEIVKKPHEFVNGEYRAKEYVFQAYPKFKYHAELAPQLVKSEEEEKALGEGWFDSPAQAQAKPEEQPKWKRHRAEGR